jgi:rhodanese-related sulfurtransferase
VRSKEAYAAGHIPGSLSNPFRESYATWLGWLVPGETALLFVTDAVPLDRVLEESLLVGYEHFAGWLGGGIEAWAAAGKPVGRTEPVDASGARKALLDGAVALDVREPSEHEGGHIEGAIHLPLSRLGAELDGLPKGRPILAYCGHGERASTAVSLLARAGFNSLLNLDGGIEAWRDAGYRLVR